MVMVTNGNKDNGDIDSGNAPEDNGGGVADVGDSGDGGCGSSGSESGSGSGSSSGDGTTIN